MRGFIKTLILFSLPIFLVIVFVFLKPLSPQFAYNFVKGECSGHGKWIHDRLYINPEPIDIAIIGTSVGWGLFDDRTLSESLSKDKGKPISVVNLSYCRPGFNMRALMVEEIIKTKHPQRIVIELRWKPSRGGHHLYGYLATTDMLLNPATRLYQPYLTDLKNAVIVRWEEVRSLLQSTDIYIPDKADYGVSPDDALVDQDRMINVLESRQKEDLNTPESIQESIHYYVYWKNMERIKHLCQDAGVELSFFYVNQFGNPVRYPKYQEEIERVAPIWYAADSVFHDPLLYADVVHFNRSGTNAITPYLYEHLAQYTY